MTIHFFIETICQISPMGRKKAKSFQTKYICLLDCEGKVIERYELGPNGKVQQVGKVYNSEIQPIRSDPMNQTNNNHQLSQSNSNNSIQNNPTSLKSFQFPKPELQSLSMTHETSEPYIDRPIFKFLTFI